VDGESSIGGGAVVCKAADSTEKGSVNVFGGGGVETDRIGCSARSIPFVKFQEVAGFASIRNYGLIAFFVGW